MSYPEESDNSQCSDSEATKKKRPIGRPSNKCNLDGITFTSGAI